MSLLWVSINCHHEGFDDLADELLDRTDDDDDGWWFYYYLFNSIIDRPIKRGSLCLVMATILMM